MAGNSYRPGRNFTANLAEAGILKINNLPYLQNKVTQNFSNYIESSGESCQDSSFSEVFGAIGTSHTHWSVMNQPKYREIINCDLTILIFSLFTLSHL